MSGINTRSASGLRLLSDTNLENPFVTGNITGFSKDSEITGFRKAQIDTIYTENGELEVNKVTSIAPLETTVESGTATVSLSMDDNRLRVNDQNELTTVDLGVDSPLDYSSDQNRMSLKFDNSCLYVNEEEKLSVIEKTPTVDSPLFINDDDKIELRYASHFNDDEGLFDLDGSVFKKGLSLKISEPFFFDGFHSHKLSLSTDSSLEIDDGELKVKQKTFEFPLYRDDETVGIEIHHPLYVSENGISLNAIAPFTTNDEGALKLNLDEDTLEVKDDKLSAKAQDATKLLKGAGAISVYKDPLESLDGAIVKLDVDHENWQQTGGKLAFRSTGLGQIPFDNGIAGLNRTSEFTFSETLNELHVPHVVLSQNLSPNNNEAVTSSYVDQLYQAGSGVDISAKVNSRREISIRTDASLSIDVNQNLSVNPSALCNNQSIRVDSNGKLSSGLIFQSMNNLGIRNNNEVFLDLHTNTQGNLEFDGSVLTDTRTFGGGLHENSSHQVELDLTVDGALSMNSTKTHITENLTASNGVKRVGNSIQGAYIGGNNISISGNTINCTLDIPEPEPEQPYVGGNGITVAGKTISSNMTLTPGSGIILVGSPGIGYTISTIDTFTQKKEATDPSEEKTSNTPEETFKSGSGSTIVSSGGLIGGLGAGIASLGGVGGGGAFVPGIASSAIGGISQLAGALTGGSLVGGFIGLWGHERKQKKDVNDDLLFDPVNGTPLLEEGSNVIIATFPDALGCDTTRLLFDIPPSCSWLGIENEYGQQAVNLQILREYDTEIILPRIVTTTSELVQPLQDQADLNTALITGLEEDIFNNYQSKITNGNKLSYSLLQDTPNLSVYATTSNIAATYVSNSSLSTTLTGYVNNASFATGMSSKQNSITSGNRLDYSLLANIPNLSIYALKTEAYNDTAVRALITGLQSSKQDFISTINKLPYANISGTPDLAPYLTRTTDLSSLNASIATKVSQSLYDIRQIALDTSIATKVSQSVFDTRQSVIDISLSNKQSTISNSLLLLGVDSNSTTLLTDNFTSAPTGSLSGNAVYDTNNKWVLLQAWGQTNSSGTLTYTINNLGRYWTLNSSLNYGSQNDDGIQIMCGGWTVYFSSWSNFTLITSPEGTNPTTIPPLSLPRVTWANVVIKLVYDTLSVYVNGTLITSHQSSPLTGTVSGTLSFKGISGGFSNNKYVDSILLTKDSNGTEFIKFAPFSNKISSQITIQDDNNYGSSMIFSASTGSNGALTEQLRIGSSGVFLAGNKLIASQEYVNTQIAAIPLSNYTLLSTYNTRQTAIDNRFTPIETRQGQLKGLSNKDIIDLSSGDVTGVLPVSKIDTSTLQERIGDYNKDELRQTLGIEWETLVGRPTLGGLALMNNVNLSTSDVSGNLDFARISNTPSYVLNSIYDTRITPIETKLTGYDTSITTKLLTLNLGTGNQPLGITINAPSSATSGNAILSMNNASSSTQWGLYHAGSAGTGGLGNGSLGFYSFSLSSHILQLKGDGQVAITTPTDSASSTSGALTVAGGVGVGKFLTIGGGAEATGLVGSGGLCFEYRTGGYKHFIRSRHHGGQLFTNALDFYINTSNTVNGSSSPGVGNINAFTIDATGVFVLPTTEATGLNTGSLQVSGGASISKKLYVGTDIYLAGASVLSSLTGKQPLHANLTSLSSVTPTLPSLSTTGDLTINGTFLNMPSTAYAQITLGNMYLRCTPNHTNGDLHFFDTIANNSILSWYNSSLILKLGGIGGASTIKTDGPFDFGINSISTHVIQANFVGNVLKIKNRKVDGFSAIQFENNNSTVSGYIGVGNSGTASPYQNMMYIKADSGLYLDSPQGGQLTRPVCTYIWDNAGPGQTNIPSAFSKVFTTTRAVQMYNGSISLYANSDNFGADISIRINGIVVKTMYLFWRYAGQILRFPISFITTGLSLGNHTFTLTWTGSNIGFDNNCRLDISFIEF